jgi:hypothetical protein
LAKIVLGAVGAALLVLAGGVGGYLLADDDADGRAESSSLPAGWKFCVNAPRGFAIGRPERWFSPAVPEADSCTLIYSGPSRGPRLRGQSVAALEIDPAPEKYADVVAGLASRRFIRIVSRKDTIVAGWPAVRLETEATGEGFADEGVKVTSYVLNRNGASFVVRTTGAPADGDYALRQETLDRAIRTLSFFEQTGAQLAGHVLPAQPELPDAVEEKRIAIAQAAAIRDYAALARLLPVVGGFEYTFGGAVEGGPTAYWRRLEATTDETPLDTLVAVLTLPYTKVRDIYVWPFAFDRDPKQLREDELALLSTFATPQEIQGWREFGGYIGWRAGIQPDGEWVFYVAGD